MLIVVSCSHPRAPVVERSPSAVRGHLVKPLPQKPPRTYRVRKGDTLHSIAWRFGLDWRRLAEWNRIVPPYVIFEGQRMRLTPPPPRRSTSTRRPPAKTSTPRSGGSHKTNTATAKTKKAHSPPPRKLRWRWPSKGKVIQTFARNDRNRRGVKIRGRYGQPVRAAEAGKVVYAGSDLIGYGKLIIIKHNSNYLSAYGFNRKILVREGEQVDRGEQIGEMGEDATGKALLHFEIRYRGSPVNPLALLRRRG
ncbi:MAG TPA: LysM peptidoglycan-binding domain-containing protein [Chromatiales bacterium]|nr:LysM peptidoglycan-binding domain-containing protein [Chromatiales bacterium]